MFDNGLLERVKKVKALVERGSPGERKAASLLLEKLVTKYHIDPDTLDEGEIEYHWFRHRPGEHHNHLMQQCIFKTMGAASNAKMYRWKGRRNLIGVECTPLQAVEIELDYAFYSVHLNNEVERLAEAFIQVNKIFPPDVKKEVVEDVDMKDVYLQRGIERRTRHAYVVSGKTRDEEERKIHSILDREGVNAGRVVENRKVE